MALYSALQPLIEANQWFKNGDHPDDHTINRINTGRVVGRHPFYKSEFTNSLCPDCRKSFGSHGMLQQHVVCPGDYIQTHRNESNRVIGYTLLKQELFEYMYGPYKEPKE